MHGSAGAMPMSAVRTILSLLAAAFLVLVLRAVVGGDFRAAGAWLLSDPWGLVTLADLYLGFILLSVVIALTERGWTALVWIVPLFFLGNLWAAIWLVLRLPALARRLA